MLLRHLHLAGPTSYKHVSKAQERLVAALLSYKANPTTTPPPPTIITTSFQPVYTCGRREVGHVSQEQRDFLTRNIPGLGRAIFEEALRGGQTTFHGPGQLTAYPILDLKKHKLSARCYIHSLETAVIQTCADFGVATRRTDNPGVWRDDNHKICAVGVHLRRNVSSHGIGLNVSTDLRWFDRIVACGLEGKMTTSLLAEGAHVEVAEAADVFVKHIAEELQDVDAIVRIDENDVS